MREWKMQERQSMESHQKKNTLKYQTKYGCRGFHAHLLPNTTHKRATIDSVLYVSRVSRGLAIRRAKERVNLTNDKRIKMCLQRLDATAVSTCSSSCRRLRGDNE